jgi:hypothetical protein
MGRKRERSKRGRKSPRGIPGSALDLEMERLLANVSKTTRLGQIARDQFTGVIDDCIVRLLQLGLCKDDLSAKQWAGKVLARAFVSLRKHHNKLSKVNRAYQDREKKLKGIRPDVLIPSSPVGVILQQELRTAKSYYRKLQFLFELLDQQPRLWLGDVNTDAVFERNRDQLLLQHFVGACRTKLKGEALERRCGALWTEEGLAAIEKAARKATPAFFYADEIAGKRRSTWEDMAREWKIPEEYWPLKDFPPLSKTTEKQWWDFIWKRLNERKDEILPLLRESAKGRAEAKSRPVYLKHFYKQFRKHWLTLVKLREAGTF